MFDPDFFPTPMTVISKMISGLPLNKMTVLEPSAGKGDILDYIVQRGGYWVMYVATSLNKRALNHYRRCDDFELCEKPIKGVNLFLTREQAEWLLDRVDAPPGSKILLPEVAQNVVNKLKEKLSK